MRRTLHSLVTSVNLPICSRTSTRCPDLTSSVIDVSSLVFKSTDHGGGRVLAVSDRRLRITQQKFCKTTFALAQKVIWPVQDMICTGASARLWSPGLDLHRCKRSFVPLGQAFASASKGCCTPRKGVCIRVNVVLTWLERHLRRCNDRHLHLRQRQCRQHRGPLHILASMLQRPLLILSVLVFAGRRSAWATIWLSSILCAVERLG